MIPSHVGGEILADHRSHDELALVHHRETVDIRLNDHPTIWPHIFAGYEPLNQAAAYLGPTSSVVQLARLIWLWLRAMRGGIDYLPKTWPMGAGFVASVGPAVPLRDDAPRHTRVATAG